MLLIFLVFCVVFLVGSVLLIFLVFCVVFCVLFVLVLCIVLNVACVSGLSKIDPPSVFSNVYIERYRAISTCTILQKSIAIGIIDGNNYY